MPCRATELRTRTRVVIGENCHESRQTSGLQSNRNVEYRPRANQK
jgi:hypothetical protein